MDLSNATAVQDFILLGFGSRQQDRLLLFIFFTALYLLMLVENITVITVVFLDAHLSQLPMYILLSRFSWMEMCYVTITVPRMLFDLASHHGFISFHACFLQFYIFFSLGCMECFFLSAMALDWYLAICQPLQYPQMMSKDACYTLVAACWIVGFLWYPIPVVLISKLSFCGHNTIDHFVCDPGPILALTCSPLGNVPVVCQIFMNVFLVCNISFVILSYSAIILSRIKISSQGNYRKTFSTISFHIMVVILFYGSVAGMYLVPGGESQSKVTKAVTLFYMAITPFLNPLIYCLRNEQMREALRRLLKKNERWLRRKVVL